MTIQDAERTMSREENLQEVSWREVIHTIVYTLNRVLFINKFGKTSYELWYGRIPYVKYFKVFGSKCYIRRDEGNLGNFDSRADEGICPGYSTKTKSYKCYNKRLYKIIESENVKVNENISKEVFIQVGYESDEGEEKNKDEVKQKETQVSSAVMSKTPRYVHKKNSENQFRGDKNRGVITRRKVAKEKVILCLLLILNLGQLKKPAKIRIG